jgi:predicted Zn-dependent protease
MLIRQTGLPRFRHRKIFDVVSGEATGVSCRYLTSQPTEQRMSPLLKTVLASILALAVAVPATARDPDDGVKVGRPSILRHLYPAASLESAASQQFLALRNQASTKGVLLPPNHPQTVRLRRIARDILPFTHKWNDRAKGWKWEVVAIQSPSINAFCMPGGKIAFFTGILDKLQLTDDEVAMIMGHEMAHALREHARERAVKSNITNWSARIVGALIAGQAGEMAGAGVAGLATLQFSRSDETESDLVGMELAARAGYNPTAAVSLWEKMATASKGQPPQWFSTHPAHDTRIKTIKDHLKEVEGLYERAKAAKVAGERPPMPNAAEPKVPPSQPVPQPGQSTVPLGEKSFPDQRSLPVPR